jgi:dGTPase
MQQTMKWEKLLSWKRLCKKKADTNPLSGRTEFQRDYDRIIFSFAFRRLQDKTQVFPLAQNDYVRTRLTHSLETSSIGRSLGTIVGARILAKHKHLNDIYSEEDFGAIVAAASLAHDIGNPPFGHSGEDAIQSWFNHSEKGRVIIKKLDVENKYDLSKFDGNAQGFRVLTRLQYPDNKGGLSLTCATLAAFTKYPRASFLANKKRLDDVSVKKHGFYKTEAEYFREIANEVGLIARSKNYAWYCRHPLAYLVEAADDICYRIIDFEDGYRLGYVKYEKIEALFMSIIISYDFNARQAIFKKISDMGAENEKIEYLRARAINSLVFQVADVFMKNESALLQGQLKKELVAIIRSTDNLNEILNISKTKVYAVSSVLEIEAAGFDVLGGLLESFTTAVNEIAMEKRKKPSLKSRKLFQLIPKQYTCENTSDETKNGLYLRVQKILDYVSGMTDSFAVSLYRKIKGISLPQG